MICDADADNTVEATSNKDDASDLPADERRLILRDVDLAQLLGCSVRHIATLDTRGLIPSPVHLGRCKRWSRPIIEAWAAVGCPPRDKFVESR